MKWGDDHPPHRLTTFARGVFLLGAAVAAVLALAESDVFGMGWHPTEFWLLFILAALMGCVGVTGEV